MTEPDAPPRRPAPTSLAAAGVVLAWFAVQLGPFVGEAPDLDAMVNLREALTFYRDGLHGLVEASAGGGIHPPLLDLLSSAAFALLGEDPRSQRLIAVVLFAVLAVGVERLLAPWLPPVQRVLAAAVVAICPLLAINLFLVSTEGLVVVVLVVALVLALDPGGGRRRPLVLGAVLALLPLVKESGLVLVLPFAIHAALTDPRRRGIVDRALRGWTVLALPLAAALVWALVLHQAGGSAWHTWILSSHKGSGAYAMALRAMLGLERGIFIRQNLANGFVVNFLWLPAALALVTVVLVVRRGAPGRLREAAALVGGLAVVYAWSVLTFPTYTEPRYAAPATLLAILLALLGLPLWHRRARPFVLGSLLLVFAVGAWGPNDPISRHVFGTTSVGGERIYDTAELLRGPDRMVVNLAVLRADRRMNARLRRLYATDASLVTGDCDAMKFGEKLAAIGEAPGAYDRGIPGARPLRCTRPEDLPPGAATGSRRVAVVRTLEDEAAGRPMPVAGPSVTIVH